jgi:hypothetical protein
VQVKTWLLPCGPWHIRIHFINSARELDCVEGGFSLPDDNGLGLSVKPRIVTTGDSLLAAFPWAIGGIRDIPLDGAQSRRAELHKPEPNLNILYPRVLVPILKGEIPRGRTVLACAVFAEPSNGGDWTEQPKVDFDAATGKVRILHDGKTRELSLDMKKCQDGKDD